MHVWRNLAAKAIVTGLETLERVLQDGVSPSDEAAAPETTAEPTIEE